MFLLNFICEHSVSSAVIALVVVHAISYSVVKLIAESRFEFVDSSEVIAISTHLTAFFAAIMLVFAIIAYSTYLAVIVALCALACDRLLES